MNSQGINTVCLAVLTIVGLLACDSGNKAAQPTSGHQEHDGDTPTTPHNHQEPEIALDLSGDWWGLVYSKTSQDHLAVLLEKTQSSTAKMATPSDMSSEDTDLWSIRLKLSQKASVMSGSCTVQLINAGSEQSSLEGNVAGKIDLVKKEVALKIDDAMDEPFGGSVIILRYQDPKPNKLAGELRQDAETEPEKPKEPPQAPPSTPDSSPSTPPSEPPPHHH